MSLYERVSRWERLMVALFGRDLVNGHGYVLGRVWCGKLYLRT